MTTATLDLTALIANQSTGYEVYDHNFNIENLKKITYVTAANGVFRVEKTATALFKTKVQEISKSIPGLRVMEEGPELLIPRIPFRFLQMALSFYLDVYDKDKTEASLLFFWNKDNKRLPDFYSDQTPVKGLLTEGQLIVYVPRQVNQGGLSEFHKDPMVNYLRDNFSLLAETHSHHTMKAYFSSIDDANENASQFYGVWGEIKNREPMFAFRYVSGEAKIQVSPDVLFEWPKLTINKTYQFTSDIEGFEPETYHEVEEALFTGPFPKIEYPEDWMGQHSRKHEAFPSKRGNRAPRGSSKQTGGRQASYSYFEDEMLPLDHFDIGIGASRFPFSGGRGIEDAEIVQFMDRRDEKSERDILDNIRDISAEYQALGYMEVIESAIGASRKK